MLRDVMLFFHLRLLRTHTADGMYQAALAHLPLYYVIMCKKYFRLCLPLKITVFATHTESTAMRSGLEERAV